MFRVVPDQLRISEGWVRCGQCEEVFDANAHLRTLDDVAAKPVPDPGQQPISPISEAIPASPLRASVPQPMQASPADAYDWGPIVVPPQPPVPAPFITGMEDSSSASALLPEQTHEPSLDEPALGEDVGMQQPEPADEAPMLQEPVSEPLETSSLVSEHVPPSFMAASPVPRSERRKLGRKVLLVLCMVLTLLLALQVLVRDRDRVAAAVPALRPVLVGICESLACSISAPRQIESIAIESSSFTSLKTGVYVLSVVLKNASALDLAAPALELTLTDTQDQVIVRRVVEPAAFGGRKEILAGAELGASIPIQVVTTTAVPRIAGYKLLAFYP
jgi:predicted Zn finger-like uncharacterized protein